MGFTTNNGMGTRLDVLYVWLLLLQRVDSKALGGG
jgi:hypothetical protein